MVYCLRMVARWKQDAKTPPKLIPKHFRKHWRKYAIAAIPASFLVKYCTRKFRENLIVRELCNKAKVYGEEPLGNYEKLRRVVVFLNPIANDMKSRKWFNKYAAPILHLSGIDVTIVDSEYEGQIRTLMNYVDPKIDGIVVAGGDGTILEVINGIRRRKDYEKLKDVPIGVIPLGEENRFYTLWCSNKTYLSHVRRIGEATMAVIRGNTKPVHLMEIKPENGHMLYALSSVQCGVFKEAYENRNSFKIFGPLRLPASYLYVAIRKWPLDNLLQMWFPAKKCSTTTLPHATQCELLSDLSAGGSQTGNPSNKVTKRTPLVSTDAGTVWDHRNLDVIAYKLFMHQNSFDEGLELGVWDSSISKSAFIKEGMKKREAPDRLLPTNTYKSSSLVLQPSEEGSSHWLSIDGEGYEPMAVAIRLLPSAFRLYCDSVSGGSIVEW